MMDLAKKKKEKKRKEKWLPPRNLYLPALSGPMAASEQRVHVEMTP